MRLQWFRRNIILLILANFAALIALGAFTHAESSKQIFRHAPPPNIVFILTDDMTFNDLKVMANVKTLLADKGVSFANFFVTNSLCCPSRASILRGQFVHNHKVDYNQEGFKRFHEYGHESSTIATWLKQVGYTTALMGKYLNGYALKHQENYVPPGWDEWDSPIDRKAYREFNYLLNENGKIVTYGQSPDDYLTDVLSRKATAFIQRAAVKKSPFFLYLATYAPHQPATAAPRHENLYAGIKAPRTPSFDERDVSAKPAFIRDLPHLNSDVLQKIDDLYRKRLQSLRAVDELVYAVVETLKKTARLNNTYIVFTSDNGFHLGQHRLPWGKQTAYDEDIRVPLVIRGPGIAAGQTRGELGLETDLAPTFAEWAGALAPSFVDGRSLVPLLRRHPSSIGSWRNGVLIEHTPGTEPFMSRAEKLLLIGKAALPKYSAIRSQSHLYVEYTTGEREFYDLAKDPAELNNIYEKTDPGLIRRFASWLANMKYCLGAVCREYEQRPLEGKSLVRPASRTHSPMILTNTRLRRRPSNSP
jgi:N-acetylglucosamine-6-sulfatase